VSTFFICDSRSSKNWVSKNIKRVMSALGKDKKIPEKNVKTNGQRSASRSRSREKIEPTNCSLISTRPSTKDCSSIEVCIVFFSLYFILILK
jgi:hypothetical protein